MPNKPDYRIRGEDEEPQKAKGGVKRRPIPTLPGQTLEDIQKRVDARIKEFLEDFDETALTRGDLDQIRNMAYMSVTSEENNKKLLAATAGLLSLTPNEFGALTKSVNDLSKEIRLVQETLGTDRRTRMSSETSELEQYLPKLQLEALNLIRKRGIYLCCLKCRATEAQTEIHQGLLIYHFADDDDTWKATFKCFRCGDTILMGWDNWQFYTLKAIQEIQPPAQPGDEEYDQDEEGD